MCAWNVYYIILCHLLHKHSGKTGILLSLLLRSLWWANSRIRFGLYITLSHYHNCANLSEDIEIIKCMSDTFIECVSDIQRIVSVIHYTIYGAVCFQFTHELHVLWWLREYILCLIIIKSEVWTIIHCLELGHETMVCAVCLSISPGFAMKLTILMYFLYYTKHHGRLGPAEEVLWSRLLSGHLEWYLHCTFWNDAMRAFTKCGSSHLGYCSHLRFVRAFPGSWVGSDLPYFWWPVWLLGDILWQFSGVPSCMRVYDHHPTLC